MQRQLHENPSYGVASLEFAPLVVQVIEQLGVSEILDYGAGKGRLSPGLRERIHWHVVLHGDQPELRAVGLRMFTHQFHDAIA